MGCTKFKETLTELQRFKSNILTEREKVSNPMEAAINIDLKSNLSAFIHNDVCCQQNESFPWKCLTKM